MPNDELYAAGQRADARVNPVPRPSKRIFRLTEDEYRDGCDEDEGRCLSCGSVTNGVEPDAREYTCEECAAPRVYGLEELMMMGRIDLCDPEEDEDEDDYDDLDEGDDEEVE